MLTETTPGADWAVILPVALPLIAAALLVMLRATRDFVAAFAILVVVAVAYCNYELLRRILWEGPLAMTMGGWLPPFGISFTADIMGAAFAMLASVVTLAVLVYAIAERRAPDAKDGFHALVLLLLAGTNGAFLTGDLFNLYVWFEVMLIASFGLMVTGGRPVQLDAAVKYGVLNFLGTTLFLLGVGLLYGAVGTLNMADIARAASAADPAVTASIGAVLLLAFGVKAAAFPVNAWLPASYHTPPAPIAALLVGLATKVGVYALLRTFLTILPATRDVLEPVLTIVAAGTLILAALGAVAETNLRRALGFVVVGGIGAALTGLALGTAASATGSIVYVVHAIVTLSTLYLVAGLIERATGEVDIRDMGGLYTASPVLGVMFLALIFAAAGVPPFLGFWPKLMLLKAALEGPLDWQSVLLTGALLLNALLILIAGTRLWSHVFWRPVRDEVGEGGLPRRAPDPQRRAALAYGATATLTILVVIAGLWPQPLISAARQAAIDLVDPQRYVEAVGLGEAP